MQNNTSFRAVHRDSARAFETDLLIPEYREESVANWTISTFATEQQYGYYSGLWKITNMPVLLRHREESPTVRELWMSISPAEIESQELGCRDAYGHTVVMGLGMAWIAVNIASMPAVDRVTVIERDPNVIALIQKSCIIPDDILKKITIVEADALQWTPTDKVDFLYIDIWHCIANEQTMEEVQAMQKNVNASLVYFWGQEMLLWEELGKSLEGKTDTDEKEEIIREYVARTWNLPLLIPKNIDYPAMIEIVGKTAFGKDKNYQTY